MSKVQKAFPCTAFVFLVLLSVSCQHPCSAPTWEENNTASSLSWSQWRSNAAVQLTWGATVGCNSCPGVASPVLLNSLVQPCHSAWSKCWQELGRQEKIFWKSLSTYLVWVYLLTIKNCCSVSLKCKPPFAIIQVSPMYIWQSRAELFCSSPRTKAPWRAWNWGTELQWLAQWE